MEIVVFAVAAFALLLAIAAFAAPAARAAGLPLPVVVAALGLAYGVATSGFGVDLAGGALDSYDLWFLDQLALDSSSLLHVFLPPLLYEMALSVNTRRLLEDWVVVMVMAVVAVAAATAAVGLSVWGGSDIGLVAALMLGAAVATTDPAAVIGTFREIGAPRRLVVLLEGESLLNDAAAIAIFSALLAAASAEAAGPLDVGSDFLWGFSVGAATGIGASVLTSRAFALLGRSAVAEASLTVALAYGAYLLAEQGFGASGVVAVVFAGLATGSQGFIRMGPGNWATVRAVWNQIGFWGNALILLIAASLTPGLLLSLDLADALLVPVVYLAALAARGLLLFAVLPGLARLGLTAPLSRSRRLLLLWGGVRGAVTLVLALSLTELGALEGDAARVGAIAAGFALMTLMINAPTLALVTRRLGLDALTPADLALRERIVAGSFARVRRVVDNLAAERDLDPVMVAEVQARLDDQAREAAAHADAEAQGERIPFGERLRLGLAILSGQESRLVRRAFEEGAIGPRATLHLRLTADRLADAARIGGRDGYEAAAAEALTAARRRQVAAFLHRMLRWDRPLREAIELDLTALTETERNLRELDRFAAATVTPMIGEEAAANLRALLASRLEEVRGALDGLAAQYPDYTAAMDRLLLARAAMRRERQQVDRLHNDGVIGPELFGDLRRELESRDRRLGRPPRLDLALSARELVDRTPMFESLTPEQKARLARLLRPRFSTPGEVVLEEGSRGDHLFVIASGALEAQGAGRDVTLANGDFFGEIALFAPARRRRTRIVSLGYCRLLTLSRRDFQRLLQREPDAERLIRDAAKRQFDLGFGADRD
ncbi:MAG: cation:proton antiporter [Pseudomonadota bacterium]|nr:cation:proton antiporter [Pseudomonadota bacterium]